MIGYLLICYVDTEKISHNQKIVDDIVSLVNNANKIEHAFTFLFKDNDEDITSDFIYNATSFLNDPMYMNWDYEDDKDEEDEDRRDNSYYEYESDYMPLYIQFVSSLEHYNLFSDLADELDIYNCDEFIKIIYEISALDQMEIFRRLQNFQTTEDKLNKFIDSTNKSVRFSMLNEFLNNHKN